MDATRRHFRDETAKPTKPTPTSRNEVGSGTADAAGSDSGGAGGVAERPGSCSAASTMCTALGTTDGFSAGGDEQAMLATRAITDETMGVRVEGAKQRVRGSRRLDAEADYHRE